MDGACSHPFGLSMPVVWVLLKHKLCFFIAGLQWSEGKTWKEWSVHKSYFSKGSINKWLIYSDGSLKSVSEVDRNFLKSESTCSEELATF